MKIAIVGMLAALLVPSLAFAEDVPRCSDSDLISWIGRQMRAPIQSVGKSLAETAGWCRGAPPIPDAPAQVDRAKVSIDRITQETAEQTARKRTCAALVKMELHGSALEFPIEYMVQQSEDYKTLAAITDPADYNLRDRVCFFVLDTLRKDTPAPVQPPVRATPTAIGDRKSIATRYGNLAILGETDSMRLVLDGRKLRDNQDYSLSFNSRFSVGNIEIILMTSNSGGVGCPAMYFFVTISGRTDVKVSPEFGTCSDLAEAIQSGNVIDVRMPDAKGKVTRYKYSQGVVTESGVPIR